MTGNLELLLVNVGGTKKRVYQEAGVFRGATFAGCLPDNRPGLVEHQLRIQPGGQ